MTSIQWCALLTALFNFHLTNQKSHFNFIGNNFTVGKTVKAPWYIQWSDLDHFYGFWQSEWFPNFWNWYQMIIAKTFSGLSFEFRLRVGSSHRRPGQSDDDSRRRLVQRISREDGSHRTFPKNLCHKKRVLKHLTITRSQIALLEPSSSLW